MAGKGPEGSTENSSEGEGWAADLSSTSRVRRTETHGTSIGFSVKDQKTFKEKLQHEKDTSLLPSASRLSTGWFCLWFIQGSDPAGHRHLRGQAFTGMHATSLQQRHHVAKPEMTALDGVLAPFLCSRVWKQHWAALDEVLRVLGSVQENGGPWMKTQLPANEGSG